MIYTFAMKKKQMRFSVTKDMELALVAEAERRGVPIAEIVREGVMMYFENAGISVDGEVERGGYRGGPPPINPYVRARMEAEQET